MKKKPMPKVVKKEEKADKFSKSSMKKEKAADCYGSKKKKKGVM